MIPSPEPELVDRFRRDLDALSPPEPLAVAVSGGPDSLALLLLAAAARQGDIWAATVDHGLRPEAAAEAEMVARVCRELDVQHVILRVTVDADRSSVQRAAREARYSALSEWMNQRGIASIATAHHVEDQAETLIMRLLRGSGVPGLAGVRANIPLPAPRSRSRLVRPLLGWRRAELRELVEGCGLVPIEDPSNSDPKFDRVRIRRLLADSGWLDALALSRSANALADADDALEWATNRIADERVTSSEVSSTLDPRGLPHEILRRLVLQQLASCGRSASPRGEDLARLIETLKEGGTATLAGFKCQGGSVWTFEQEKPRRT